MARMTKTRRGKEALCLTPVKFFALCVSRGFEKFATVSSSIRQHSPRLIERRRKGALLHLLLLVASSWDPPPPPLPPALSPSQGKVARVDFWSQGDEQRRRRRCPPACLRLRPSPEFDDSSNRSWVGTSFPGLLLLLSFGEIPEGGLSA